MFISIWACVVIVFVPAQACRGEDQHRRGESFHRPVHGAPRGDQQSGCWGRARCCRRASAGTSWPRWPSTGPPSWRTRWPPTACSCTEAGVSLFIWNLWGVVMLQRVWSSLQLMCFHTQASCGRPRLPRRTPAQECRLVSSSKNIALQQNTRGLSAFTLVHS